jgi:methyl-accepting chemotaxis protein
VRVWRNARIRTKVGIGLSVALVGLAGFAVTNVSNKQAEASSSAQVKTLASLSVKAGNLLHETQRERGRTSQFTSSKGKKFGAELTAQRKLTDAAIGAYRGYVSAHADELPAAVDKSLRTVADGLGTVKGLRSKADGLATNPVQIIGGYTKINKSLLDMISVTVGENRNPTIAVRLQAYVALLSAKESAGIERAQLSNVFTKDKFAPGQFTTVVSLIAAQEAYLTVFQRAASEDVLGEWDKTKSAPAFDQVAGFEKTAIAKSATGKFGVKTATWFDAATAKINAYKSLEDYQAEQILATAADAEGAATGAALIALATAVVLLLLTLAIATAVILSITRPLRHVADIAEQLAVGDVSREVTYTSGDELGHLADSFRKLGEYMRESAGVAAALAKGDLTATVRPRGQGDLLGNALQETVSRLSSMVGQIQTSGQQLTGSAGELMSASSALVTNAEETTSKATEVSTASEQMIAAIAEISRSTSQAAEVARSAVGTASEASHVIAGLSEASAEISGVVELIEAIASQTNLLALNATIEASRAGEAGKGFAVVAEEVKRLAQQTADATTNITQRVGSIEQGATAAAKSVVQIGEIVSQINEIAMTIAGAVEEQTVTTSEISRSVTVVAEAAHETTRITNVSAESGRALADMATTLEDLVAQFTVDAAPGAFNGANGRQKSLSNA